MAQVLELQFETATGKAITFSVDEPREDVTALDVQNGMQAIIDSQVFYVEGNAISVAKSARIVERNVTELI
ncbi:DUF2922 domain-containing protein [Paenisporosarcina cavernae]|uniref:DUF2922 domain-containing protein n=1 Tax=Paenisporosarcina cavernae TaxID=2320858 RepID=A0A385YRU1_9BACL|nr:DUF2922 domain-containing protein [Paenisporosarcina cavernae]AYC29495.1 DUF2922 domain-containing protein [Paenisporosarcina cavernae]